jgi:hypothetical protein
MILAFAAVVALAAICYTLFVRDRDIPEPLPVSPVQHLLDRKQAIYDNLRDLQFEYRLGKLSEGDYQQTKLALQKELALVLAETEETTRNLGLRTAAAPVSVPTAKPKKSVGTVCPHCGASFAQALKFCGECGKAMT